MESISFFSSFFFLPNAILVNLIPININRKVTDSQPDRAEKGREQIQELYHI
jgi:hypothetical protein